MTLSLHRWELFDGTGRGRVVLRLHRDGLPLSDPGTDDHFASAELAAQVAARLDGGAQATLPAWMETAHAVLQLPSEGRLDAQSFSPPRLVDAAALLSGKVRWCLPPGHTSGGRQEAPEAPIGREPSIGAPGQTARAPQGTPVRPPQWPPAAAAPAGHLSGDESGEWIFADQGDPKGRDR